MMKFFLRISRFSDRGWRSYRLPEGAEWTEYESLEQMLEAGAYRTEGLAGIEWSKPYAELDDVVFPAGHPALMTNEDVTVRDLVADGFIVRVYAGEKLEDLQDGVIFRPRGLTKDEAWKLMDEYDICFERKAYEGGLLDAHSSFHIPPSIVWNEE